MPIARTQQIVLICFGNMLFVERFKILGELFSFLWKQKLWWLIPMLAVFLVIGILILFVGSSPLAPIVYPLF